MVNRACLLILLGSIILLCNACTAASYAFMDFTVSSASAKMTPETESIHLGQGLRINVSLPLRSAIIDVDTSSADYLENLKKYHDKYVSISVANQLTRKWSGQIRPQIGVYSLSPFFGADSAHGQLDPVNADSIALGVVVFFPSDTGTYIVQISQVTVGNSCSSFQTDSVKIHQNTHLNLLNSADTVPAISYYPGRFYLFKVVP